MNSGDLVSEVVAFSRDMNKFYGYVTAANFFEPICIIDYKAVSACRVGIYSC